MISKKYFILFSVFVILLYILSKFICFDKDAAPGVSYYSRSFTGGIDNDTTFYPQLKISNYRDGDYTVKELFQLAKLYLDTVKGIKKTGGVELYGEPPCKKMPYPNSWTIDEFYLISFYFLKGSDSIEVTDIYYWEKGVRKSFESYWGEKKSIDSMMNVKTKFRRN